MVTRKGGMRRKSRHKFSKHYTKKGKLKVNQFLQVLKEGDKVILFAEVSYQGGLYKSSYHGKSGKVVGSQGRCYKVSIKDGGKQKTIIVHPVHLKVL